MIRIVILLVFFQLSSMLVHAQRDTLPRTIITSNDTTIKRPIPPAGKKVDSVLKYHSPKKAAIRSAILPGLGQIYNKKYWKLPIVYGALGITGSVFAYNLKNYRDIRFAYKAKFLAGGSPPDSSLLPYVRPNLAGFDINTLLNYRNEFRRNIDYTVLIFIALWGLNVVDATVDAHLKSFDVSPDLSFRIKMGKSELASTTGLSFILALK